MRSIKKSYLGTALELKSFRLWVKGKHLARRKFQILAVQGKKLLTSRNGDGKIMPSVRIVTGHKNDIVEPV